MPGSDHSGGVGRVVEAGGGVEDRPARGGRVGGRQFASGDAVGDDPGQLAGEVVDVGPDHPAGVGGQLEVGGEQLRVLAGHRLLGGDQQVQPVPEPLRRRAGLGGRGRQRCRDAGQPAFGDASRSAALLGKWR
jgi:hypothetical protein